MSARRLAITIAILGFFAFAALGWFRGHSLEVIATRAGLGMLVLYVIVLTANRIVIRVVTDTIVKNVPEHRTIQDRPGGRAAE